MPLQGRARGSGMFDLRHKNVAKAPSIDGMSWMRKARSDEKGDEDAKAKQAYSWLKDAHAFAQANKENLDDPDVQEVLQLKMQKAEQGGLFSRTPKHGQKMIEGGGEEMAVEAPMDNTLQDIENLSKRFMVENPAQYKPTQADVMKDGEYGRYEFDPIHGDRKLGTPVEKVAEGSALVAGDKPIYERKKTPTPGKPGEGQVLSYNIQDPNKTKWVNRGEDAPEGYTFNKPGKETGQLTKKQKLDILYDVENQIAELKNKEVEPTQADVDKWNRQLEQSGAKERVSLETVKKEKKFWFDSEETTARVGKPSLSDIFQQ